MTIPLPNLDDRRFEDLVAEGKRLIPGLAPSWTDHNPSDPGITFLELFAYLGEMLIYRANRISTANKRAFVALLRGPDYAILDDAIDEEIRSAVLALKDEQRGITAADVEFWAKSVQGVARAHCLPRRNLEAASPYVDAPAHLSVVVVPVAGPPTGPPQAGAQLRQAVWDVLAPRILLTTRLHVVSASYVPVSIHLEVHVFVDQNEQALADRVGERLGEYFAPFVPGAGNRGWPFGQVVYVSDLYATLDNLDGVDFVGPITAAGGQSEILTSSIADRNIHEGGHTVGLRLEADELVWLDKLDIRIVRQTATVPES